MIFTRRKKTKNVALDTKEGSSTTSSTSLDVDYQEPLSAKEEEAAVVRHGMVSKALTRNSNSTNQIPFGILERSSSTTDNKHTRIHNEYNHNNSSLETYAYLLSLNNPVYNKAVMEKIRDVTAAVNNNTIKTGDESSLGTCCGSYDVARALVFGCNNREKGSDETYLRYHFIPFLCDSADEYNDLEDYDPSDDESYDEVGTNGGLFPCYTWPNDGRNNHRNAFRQRTSRGATPKPIGEPNEEEFSDDSIDDDHPILRGYNYGNLHSVALQVLINSLEMIACHRSGDTDCTIDFQNDMFWPRIVDTLKHNLEIMPRNHNTNATNENIASHVEVTLYSLKCLQLLYKLDYNNCSGYVGQLIRLSFVPYLLFLEEEFSGATNQQRSNKAKEEDEVSLDSQIAKEATNILNAIYPKRPMPCSAIYYGKCEM